MIIYYLIIKCSCKVGILKLTQIVLLAPKDTNKYVAYL